MHARLGSSSLDLRGLRRLLLGVSLVGLASSLAPGCGGVETQVRADASAFDAGDALDGAARPDADSTLDVGVGLDGGTPPDVDSGPASDAAAAPVDCAPIAATWMLCEATPDECRVVFEDSAGCATVCAAAGLVCRATYENATTCGPDTARPALSCDVPSGHGSDYCVCGRPGACTPDCGAAVCGPDGCGGTCGSCASGERCTAGACAPAPVDCSTVPYDTTALLSELVGFGRNTTGGDPTNVYHVTNTRSSGAGSLRTALESTEDYWIVFDVGDGAPANIDLGDADVAVLSNKTIDGRGRDITIDAGIFLRTGTRNVIFTDVRMTNSHGTRCTQDADIVSIRSAGAATAATFPTRDIWFHHVELFEGGDGLIDVRGGSRITISWSSFHDHSKGFLFGMESAPELEGREMEITMHHNYFNQISRRSPQLSWGRLHLFNNYERHWWEFAAASLANAQLASEANIFEARPGSTCGTFFTPCMDPAPCGDTDYMVSKVGISNDWATTTRGYVRSTGDLLLNDATIAVREPTRVFTPDYPYVAETATATLASRIAAEAGPRVDYCTP